MGLSFEPRHQRLPQLPEVVEIGIAEQQLRLGGLLLDGGNVIANGGVAGDVDQFKFPATGSQELLHRQHKGRMDRLNAAALELFAVGPQPGQVGRQKGDLPTQALEQSHLVEGGLAAGIPIRLGRRMVQHQGPANDAAILQPFRLLPGGFPRGQQGVVPLVSKQGGMLQLQAFDALGVRGVNARGGALMVDNPS